MCRRVSLRANAFYPVYCKKFVRAVELPKIHVFGGNFVSDCMTKATFRSLETDLKKQNIWQFMIQTIVSPRRMIVFVYASLKQPMQMAFIIIQVSRNTGVQRGLEIMSLGKFPSRIL